MTEPLRTVLKILGKVINVGGESPESWIPSNASTPPPTPIVEHVVDIRILDGDGGFILEWQSSSPDFSNDSWHATIEEALKSAEELFGVERLAWREATANQ